MIQVGERVPSVILKRMGENGIEDVATEEFFKGRKVALIGVPGAFTPTCSQQHLPSYVEKAGDLKAKGVDEIACLAVNDPFVMKEWAKASAVDDKVTLLSDGNAEFTKAANFEFDGSAVGLGMRCKRFSMLVDDGVVKALHVEDSPGAMEVTGADKLLAEL